jgi:hypothetical protein
VKVDIVYGEEGSNREGGEGAGSRHVYQIFRNSEAARLGRIDVGPTSQWTCSRRWQEISTEITTAEAGVDRDLAPIAALECQQLMDALAQRLPRELREKIYEWLVPIESFQHYIQIVSQDFTNDKRTTCHTLRSTPAWIQFLNVLLHEGWPFRRDYEPLVRTYALHVSWF